MDETYLTIFTFELPDPDQALFPNSGAAIFTCFPKFPMEVRLMIWRAAFPRARRIELRLQFYVSLRCDGMSFEQNRKRFGAPKYRGSRNNPITLRLNRESRQETLKHCLLCYQDLPSLRKVPGGCGRHLKILETRPKPIYFSPGRDLLILPGRDLLRPLQNALFSDFAEKCLPISKVRTILINQIYRTRIEDITEKTLEQSYQACAVFTIWRLFGASGKSHRTT